MEISFQEMKPTEVRDFKSILYSLFEDSDNSVGIHVDNIKETIADVTRFTAQCHHFMQSCQHKNLPGFETLWLLAAINSHSEKYKPGLRVNIYLKY